MQHINFKDYTYKEIQFANFNKLYLSHYVNIKIIITANHKQCLYIS